MTGPGGRAAAGARPGGGGPAGRSTGRAAGGTPAGDGAVDERAAGGPRVGALLRHWRTRRRLTQLELALRAETSARHLSFVETGRSQPSREMLLRLAEQLDVPVRERNALLVAGGFAPSYPATPLDDPVMAPVQEGVRRLLDAYAPYPALLFDGGYDVLAANSGVALLLEGVDPELLRPPMNAVRLSLHPRGLAPRIRNLGQWRAHLLDRVERQMVLRDSARLRRLYEEVRHYPAPEPEVSGPYGSAGVGAGELALPMRIRCGDAELAFLSTATTFNTPMDVTVSELAIETFLPADAATAEALAAHR
ncbi:helix-turn-helix transcriptional regulator [Allostreptomyces psammosilenae]